MAKDNVTPLRGDDGDDDEVRGRAQIDRERERLEAEQAEADAKAKAEAGDAGGEGEEEADGQFALEIPNTGRKINLGTLIPRGTPVEVKYKMSGKSVPNVKGGLMDPADTTGLLLVSYVVEDVQTKFTRDADHKIEKATVYVVIGLRHVVNARSEAGDVLLRGEAQAA